MTRCIHPTSETRGTGSGGPPSEVGIARFTQGRATPRPCTFGYNERDEASFSRKAKETAPRVGDRPVTRPRPVQANSGG